MMRVLDDEPYVWRLLTDGQAFYLDADCSHSFLDYSVLVALTDDEAAAWRSEGRHYLTRLARAIHDSAPAARESRSPFKARNLMIHDREKAESATAAISSWTAGQAEAPDRSRSGE